MNARYQDFHRRICHIGNAASGSKGGQVCPPFAVLRLYGGGELRETG